MSERKAALPRDLKQKNYEAILRALADKKTFAVNQIADATKISRLTVAKAVESFIEHEIVIPAGKGSSTSVGGKKPKEYTLNPDRYVICISPAQQHLTFTLISLNGVVHDCIEMDFQARIMTASYQEYLKNTTDNIVMLVEKNHISPEQVLGVIACFGGIIDSQNGMIITSYPRHWGQNLPVVEDLKKLIPFPVKIYIENVSKVTASILMFDPEAADKKVAVVYTDYGTAITFLDNGMIPATRHHTSGEFGHICLEPDDEDVCDCGARGCLEVLISQRRISRLVDALDKKAKNALLADY
ncbi:MAG: ROK family protein, partial [Solobacterium sp.]|nr:ROK family protein [Solobacterium sp.]